MPLQIIGDSFRPRVRERHMRGVVHRKLLNAFPAEYNQSSAFSPDTAERYRNLSAQNDFSRIIGGLQQRSNFPRKIFEKRVQC
jgi:hypothetical protein